MPWLADLALVGALAWMVIGWVQRPGPFPAPASTPASSKHATIDVAALAAMPLFGAAENKAAPKPLPVVPSTLNLKLVGTVVTDDGSAAIVKGIGNEQRVAMIGDVLMPGVVLKRISTDAIEVEHQGRLERIALPKPTLAPAVGGGTGAPVPGPVPHAVGGLAAGSMSALMRQARLVPHFDHGKVDGILVAGVRPGSVFAAMGLKDADVIHTLNGQPIDAPQRITNLYQAIIDSRPIDIGLERGGKYRQLHYKPAMP